MELPVLEDRRAFVRRHVKAIAFTHDSERPGRLRPTDNFLCRPVPPNQTARVGMPFAAGLKAEPDGVVLYQKRGHGPVRDLRWIADLELAGAWIKEPETADARAAFAVVEREAEPQVLPNQLVGADRFIEDRMLLRPAVRDLLRSRRRKTLKLS